MTQKEKATLAKAIANLIDAEMEKPQDDINMEFIEECQNRLSELVGPIALSEAQIERKLHTIMQTKSQKRNFHPQPHPRIAIPVFALITLFVLTFSVYAFVPSVRETVHHILQLPTQTTVEQNGILVTNNGTVTEYKNIEEFIEKENLDILYPHDLPKNLKIETILCLSESEYTIVFSENQASIFIRKAGSDAKPSKYATQITYNNITFHIVENENKFYATAHHNSWIYDIETPSHKTLAQILESIH